MHITSAEPNYLAISKKVDEDFACQHAHGTTIRKKMAADGAISIWHQCNRCGRKVGVAIRKASMTHAQVAALPLWDAQIEIGFYAAKKKHFDEIYTREKERLSADWLRDYEQYLRLPEWKHKRELVLTRAHGICEGCLEAQATDVHHLTYDDAGQEFLFQLVALCRKCHERWHGPARPSVSAPPATQAPPSLPPKGDTP